MDRRITRTVASYLTLACMLVVVAGCTGVAAQIMYMVKGLKVDAEYDGLENSRVAIICVSDASSYGPDTLTNSISRALAIRLNENVKKIELVPQSEIEIYKDTHGWNQLDFVSIGKGLEAEKVLAIEIGTYSIHDGPTMYKGRAMVTTTVYDIENQGEIVFSHGPLEYQFPRSHGRPSISTSEQRFEAIFLSKLVDSIAYHFHEHERVDQIADDATMFE